MPESARVHLLDHPLPLQSQCFSLLVVSQRGIREISNVFPYSLLSHSKSGFQESRFAVSGVRAQVQGGEGVGG